VMVASVMGRPDGLFDRSVFFDIWHRSLPAGGWRGQTDHTCGKQVGESYPAAARCWNVVDIIDIWPAPGGRTCSRWPPCDAAERRCCQSSRLDGVNVFAAAQLDRLNAAEPAARARCGRGPPMTRTRLRHSGAPSTSCCGRAGVPARYLECFGSGRTPMQCGMPPGVRR
jgi:hypothetical protein